MNAEVTICLNQEEIMRALIAYVNAKNGWRLPDNYGWYFQRRECERQEGVSAIPISKIEAKLSLSLNDYQWVTTKPEQEAK